MCDFDQEYEQTTVLSEFCYWFVFKSFNLWLINVHKAHVCMYAGLEYYTVYFLLILFYFVKVAFHFIYGAALLY